MMKQFILVLILLGSSLTCAQNKDLALQKSNDYVYQGNELLNEDFAAAEMEYRKAISKKPSNAVGAYNLGNAYYKNGKFSEALLRHQEAIKSMTSKEERHKAFHNIGNTLMQNKQCKEAVEAYKNALRNNPNDDETRYNLGLAKECAKEQGGGGEDENQDQQEEQEKEDNKDKQDEGENEKDKEDEGEQDEKEGDEEENEEGQPKDEKEDKGKGEEEKKEQKPKPKQGQLSPQQIKNLLEAMNDQEQKVQEKINEIKAKGVKVKNDKDW